jgi:CubicO group peptidase (beta-lactamase class C family)
MNINNLTIHTGETHASPEEAGFNPAKLDQLDAFLADLIGQQKLQCAGYLLSRNGKIFAAKSMGKLTYHENSPELMPDSIRYIASITKSITALAVMKLIEDGKIYLGQLVKTIIEEFDTPLHENIQIFHLLTHTSGLKAIPGYFTEPYPADDEDIKPGDNWIKKALEGPLQAELGTAWIYSNWNYIILGEIITRVSGMDFQGYISQNIFQPLGMENTFYKIPKEYHDRICVIQEWEEQVYVENMYPSNYPLDAAGGVSSNLYDLWKLGQMILNKGSFNGAQVLGRKTVEAMTRNHLTNTPAYFWGYKIKALEFGLGWYFDYRDLVTPGTISNEGYGRSALFIDPVEQFVAVYFVPSKIHWFAEQMINPRAIMWSGLL